MQLDWDDHFREIVVPACENLAAERPLSEATAARDPQLINPARFDTLREAGAACLYLYHSQMSCCEPDPLSAAAG